MMTAVIITVYVFKLTSMHMAPVTAHPDKCLMVRCVRKVSVAFMENCLFCSAKVCITSPTETKAIDLGKSVNKNY